MDTKLKRKKIAGIMERNGFNREKQDEEDELNRIRKSTIYRHGPTRKSDLIRPQDKKHQRILRKQEEALGITSLA